jgi:RimJ/RimL family protein N-acetyltransferase
MIQTQMLRLRTAQKSDAQLLWEWANDPQVRAASFSSDPIPWERHVQWFYAQLKSPNCIIYIAINSDNIPLGQIRYEIEENNAVMSISIAKNYRHQGYGSELIKLACDRLFQDLKISQIHAYIKPDNQSSIRSFIKADFVEIGTTNWPKSTANNQLAMHLVKQIRSTNIIASSTPFF